MDIEFLLVIGYAAVDYCFLAGIHDNERQVDSSICSGGTLFLFHLFVPLNKVFKSNLL